MSQGGLWKTPTGTITKPGAGEAGLHHSIFYLPQKPYNVLGSLKANIVYPSEDEAALSFDRLRELLQLVELVHLLPAKDGGVEADAGGGDGNGADELINWEGTLSLGEQQRLAMARLFYHCTMTSTSCWAIVYGFPSSISPCTHRTI